LHLARIQIPDFFTYLGILLVKDWRRKKSEFFSYLLHRSSSSPSYPRCPLFPRSYTRHFSFILISPSSSSRTPSRHPLPWRSSLRQPPLGHSSPYPSHGVKAPSQVPSPLMAAPLCSLVSPHASSGKQPWRPAPARLAPLCLWRAPVSHGVGPQPLGTGRPYSLLLFLPWCPSRVCPSPLPLGSLLVTLLSMGAQVSSPWWQIPCQARPMSELRRLSSLLLSPWRLRLHCFYFFPSSIPPCLYASSSTPEQSNVHDARHVFDGRIDQSSSSFFIRDTASFCTTMRLCSYLGVLFLGVAYKKLIMCIFMCGCVERIPDVG
jgi:hypothetical protein